MTEPGGLQGSGSFDWFRIVSATDFGARTAGSRQVSEVHLMAICGQLFRYADPDGTNVFPSIGRLALETGMSYEIAKTAMRLLRELGLIEQVARGGGRSGNNTARYRLTIPDDLLSKVKVRSPTEITDGAKRITRVSTGRAS